MIPATRGSASRGISPGATSPSVAAVPGRSPRSMAMPVSAATMVFDTDFTFTARSTGGSPERLRRHDLAVHADDDGVQLVERSGAVHGREEAGLARLSWGGRKCKGGEAR